VLVVIGWIPQYAEFVKNISPQATTTGNEFEIMSQTVPRQIANAHTVFSIGLAVLLFPFLNLLSKLIVKLLPDKVKPELYKLKYINSAVNSSPALALSLAKKEAERMSHKVKWLVSLGLKPFLERDEVIMDKWQHIESETDFLKDRINKYLVSVSSENSDQQQLNEAFQIMYVVKELEMIGDIINTNIRHQAVKWLANDVNLEKAELVRQKFKKYAGLAEEFEKHHYERLIQNNEKTAQSSETHLELLGLLNAINRHATNISRILLNWRGKE
jgi:phosphate:Na+ symporter